MPLPLVSGAGTTSFHPSRALATLRLWSGPAVLCVPPLQPNWGLKSVGCLACKSLSVQRSPLKLRHHRRENPSGWATSSIEKRITAAPVHLVDSRAWPAQSEEGVSAKESTITTWLSKVSKPELEILLVENLRYSHDYTALYIEFFRTSSFIKAKGHLHGVNN